MMEVLSRPNSLQTRPLWDSLHDAEVPDSGLYSKPTMLMTSQPRNPQDLRGGKVDSGKTQASIRLMKMMLRNRRTSLQELRSHENFLTRLNGELVRNIQDMEDSAAQKVRAMLQQQDIFATVMDILEYSNNKKLQQMKCELQEWQEKEEAKMRHLERQVEQLNARIHKTKEEVSFLSTYMDHEYPVRSVQIASLARQLQQVKDSQQDELDDLNEMRRKVLESLSNKIQKKKRKLLRSLVVKTQSPYEEALLQKTRDSRDILKCTGRFREFIKHFEEEIPILRAEVQQLQVQLQEPRDIIFADVLLRRPKYVIFLQLPLKLAALQARRGSPFSGKAACVEGRTLDREEGHLGFCLGAATDHVADVTSPISGPQCPICAQQAESGHLYGPF
ncbi:uncharacterized protein C20orf96 homolog isoform X2 [Equus przewalskii]|uniref:Uncharacterized protein C20orf96 homolog isoform X2 n=1 Tax=Equus przewalskii TaxID=9798 RepID=A0ABM4LXH4_EQUPR